MELSADKASCIYSQHNMFDIGVLKGNLNVFHGGNDEMVVLVRCTDWWPCHLRYHDRSLLARLGSRHSLDGLELTGFDVGLIAGMGKVDDWPHYGLYCPKMGVFHSNAKVGRKDGGTSSYNI